MRFLSSREFDRFLADPGIRREHSIRDTPQQLGVAERLNRTLDEGVTTLLSQSGPSWIWWPGGRGGAFSLWQIKTPIVRDRPALTSKRGFVDRLQPFGLPPLCKRISAVRFARGTIRPYWLPYRFQGWQLWDPDTKNEIVSDKRGVL